MSNADGWDLTVPEDTDELVAELRRHGWLPGRRFHIVQTPEIPAKEPGRDFEPEPKVRRDMPFIGSVPGGPPDLAAKTDEYLQRGFGR